MPLANAAEGRSGRLAARAARWMPTLAGGAVAGLLTVLSAITSGGLIFSGALASGMLAGISAILGGTALACIAVAATSSHRSMVAGPLGSTAVIYGLIATALQRHFDQMGVAPMQQAALVVAACGVVTVAAGIVFLILGAARLGSLARFLPYPVVSGYNAGAGWLFVVGALVFTTDLRVLGADWRHLADPSVRLETAACIALGLLMFGLSRRLRHWFVVPGLMLASVLLFHVGRAAAGIALDTVMRDGWLLGPFPAGPIWTAPRPDALLDLTWPALVSILSPTLTLILVGGTSLIMMIIGLELELREDLDLNREMRVGGLSALVSGMAGGIVSAQLLSTVTITHRMGANSRLTGLVVAACCVAMLAAGAEPLGLVPRFVVGALLFQGGLDRLIDRLWTDRSSLPRHEWIIVLLVVLCVIWLGYPEAVAFGLALTLVIFAWNYRRIPVIRTIVSAAEARSSVVRSAEAQSALAQHAGEIRVCKLQGYLFFLNTTEIPAAVARILAKPGSSRLGAVILDFGDVVGMDGSAGLLLRRVVQLAQDNRFRLWFTHLAPGVRDQLRRNGVLRDAVDATDTTDEALHAAEDLVLARAGIPVLGGRETLACALSARLGTRVTEERLAPYLTRLQVRSGTVLIREGDPADAMYFIEEGRVSAQLNRNGAPAIRLRTTTAGTIVGEVGIFSGGRRTASVIAEGACTAARIDTEAIGRMERDDPPLAGLLHRFLATLLADKLADSNRLMETMLH